MSTRKDLAVSKAIDFLESNAALDLGTAPWGTYSEDEEVFEVDYDELMSDSEDRRHWEFPLEVSNAIESALNQEGGSLATDIPGSNGRRPANVAWDTCAWYQAIHFFAQDWGIFIREQCLMNFAVDLARWTDRSDYQREKADVVASRKSGRGPTPSWSRLSDAEIFVRAAFILLYLHEAYHHRIECLGLRLHVVTRTPLYVPYFHGIYIPCKGTDDLLEEALANACMYLRLFEDTYRKALPLSVLNAMRQLLRVSFPEDPPGYRKAVDYLKEPLFERGENRLQGYVRETSLTPTQRSVEWDTAPRLTQSFLGIKSNIYAVVPVGARPVLPPVVLPKSCSTQDMVKLCKRFQYGDPEPAKGSHIKLRKAGHPTVILPQRKDLSPGVIKNTLAAVGPFKLKDLPGLLAMT